MTRINYSNECLTHEWTLYQYHCNLYSEHLLCAGPHGQRASDSRPSRGARASPLRAVCTPLAFPSSPLCLSVVHFEQFLAIYRVVCWFSICVHDFQSVGNIQLVFDFCYWFLWLFYIISGSLIKFSMFSWIPLK